MSEHVIKVPDIGEGIAEVELVAWHVQPGDGVAEDQVLADVMTDKATVEIPSPIAGRVLALGGEVGQMLAVGSELIRLESAGDAAAAPPPPPRAAAAAPAGDVRPASQPEAAASPRLAPSPAPSPTSSPSPLATTAPARTPAPASSTARATAIASASAAACAPAARPIASPALRARAWELGIDLHAVSATGTGGRITQRDLDACVASGKARAQPGAPGSAPGPASSGAMHTEKIVGLRRKIAQRMQESKRRIPHFTYVEEVDVTELEALRARLNAKYGEARGHLTLLAFLVRAVVLAVREVPQVNARFDDEAGLVTRHDAVHVGIATQTAGGLMVPVLRDAQARSLWSNAAEIVRLAEAAHSGRIVRDELAGSTITITSLGRLGGIVSTPVINHPEVAIVGVNRIVLRPTIREGAVVARQLMNLSSSFDHRVVDGAQAAAFVQGLRECLEHPAMLFVQ
jgi:2-oxoisovalerate dehydrogenase E2 component (dihydrolipoyl transacylase)